MSDIYIDGTYNEATSAWLGFINFNRPIKFYNSRYVIKEGDRLSTRLGGKGNVYIYADNDGTKVLRDKNLRLSLRITDPKTAKFLKENKGMYNVHSLGGQELSFNISEKIESIGRDICNQDVNRPIIKPRANKKIYVVNNKPEDRKLLVKSPVKEEKIEPTVERFAGAFNVKETPINYYVGTSVDFLNKLNEIHPIEGSSYNIAFKNSKDKIFLDLVNGNTSKNHIAINKKSRNWTSKKNIKNPSDIIITIKKMYGVYDICFDGKQFYLDKLTKREVEAESLEIKDSKPDVIKSSLLKTTPKVLNKALLTEAKESLNSLPKALSKEEKKKIRPLDYKDLNSLLDDSLNKTDQTKENSTEPLKFVPIKEEPVKAEPVKAAIDNSTLSNNDDYKISEESKKAIQTYLVRNKRLEDARTVAKGFQICLENYGEINRSSVENIINELLLSDDEDAFAKIETLNAALDIVDEVRKNGEV